MLIRNSLSLKQAFLFLNFAGCLTISVSQAAAGTCVKILSQNETNLKPSEISRQNDIIGFKHHSPSTRNIISTLSSGILYSQIKAKEKGIEIDLGYVATHRKDFVYLSPIYNREFDLIPFQGSEGRYYVSQSKDPLTEPAIIRFTNEIIDRRNFVHASRDWLYGKFDPRLSFLAKDLSLFFGNKLRPRGEFVFQNELPLDLTQVEVWVAPHLRPEVIRILSQAHSQINWGNVVKSKNGKVITDPRELTDDDYLNLRNAQEALLDLWNLNREEAVRIAQKVLESPVASDKPVKGMSLHIIKLFEQTEKGQRN